MSTQIWIFFLVFANVLSCMCQLTDSFDDKSLGIQWIGDRDQYYINDDMMLQLQATGAGSASLYSSITLSEDMEWNMDIDLRFDPSSRNQLLIYLYRTALDDPSDDALYLLLGSNGNDDALELHQRTSGEDLLLASGSAGLLSQSPLASISVVIDSDGICSISLNGPTIGCVLEDILVPVQIPLTESSVYFGITCRYTATRSDKFLFDNIYVGLYVPDMEPPVLTDISYRFDTMTFYFNEPVLASYELTIHPAIQYTDSLIDKRAIYVMAPFEAEQNYVLAWRNIHDLNENKLDTTVMYTIPQSPQPGDILINELLFNPISNGADYIELINVSSRALSMQGMMVGNRDKNVSFPIFSAEIRPDEILVLTDNKENIIQNYPTHDRAQIYEQLIPSWNNDAGNAILTFRGITIDALDYNEDMHLALLDQVDGVSLERISVTRASADNQNWTSASAANQYGTPGLMNSASVSIPEGNNVFRIERTIFSPNDDGDGDELIVHYQLNSPGYIATVGIYADNGLLIRTLLQNASLSTQGTIVWDGTNDSGQKQAIGLYICYISLFTPDGQRHQEKFSFGLADHLD